MSSTNSPLEKDTVNGMPFDQRMARLPAYGGEYAPPAPRKFANPAPLGLSAFALTTFVLGCINMGTRNITEPSIVIGPAFGYGGLVQLLAGMWEMAVGNTFGATALSSYGGFWIAFAIILTPGGFQVVDTLEKASPAMFFDSLGLLLMGFFIFTFILLLCTLRSSVAFFSLFFCLDMAFLVLGIGYLQRNDKGLPNTPVIKAGGCFALLAAFLAWYNALAGIADSTNSFITFPVFHFPWSDQARGRKSARDTV